MHDSVRNVMIDPQPKRVFVTGGTGFLGYRVVRALLEENAAVTVLVRPGAEDKLGALRGHVQWVQGDVWNPASLKGRARGHQVVVHLVGGIKPEPKRGLTFRHLNFVSARNVAQMAVSDGVPHLMLLSATVKPPGVQSGYIDSKREAEDYLRKTGLTWTIVRAPPLYVPGQRRNATYVLLSALRLIPLVGLLANPLAPLSVEIVARGIARLALSADSTHDRLITPGRLRALGWIAAPRRAIPSTAAAADEDESFDEPPFGWQP